MGKEKEDRGIIGALGVLLGTLIIEDKPLALFEKMSNKVQSEHKPEMDDIILAQNQEFKRLLNPIWL